MRAFVAQPTPARNAAIAMPKLPHELECELVFASNFHSIAFCTTSQEFRSLDDLLGRQLRVRRGHARTSRAGRVARMMRSACAKRSQAKHVRQYRCQDRVVGVKQAAQR